MRAPFAAALLSFALGCSGGGVPPAPIDAGLECPVVGTWSGFYACPTLGGWPVSWRFDDDGGASLTQGWPPGTQSDARWAISRRQLTFTELDNPSCATAATYQLAFDGGCADLGFSLGSDACAVRSECLDGLVLTRQ